MYKPTKKHPAKTLLKVLIFFILIYVMDLATGTGLRHLYFSGRVGRYFDLTYAIDSTKADIIVIGSSRAKNDYVAQNIEDSLHLSCYNAGYEGSLFLHQYAVLKCILRRYHPKIIIWDYWRGLEKNPEDYLELSTLLPYYKSHEDVRPIINLRGPYERYKLISKIYPYNSTVIYTLNKKINFYKNTDKDDSHKGFTPLYGVWKDTVELLDKIVTPIDSVTQAAYLSVINFCNYNHIKLFVVIAPHYALYKSTPNYDSIARALAIRNKVQFLDFSKDTTFIKPYNPYFSNRIHLNKKGAEVFTKKLISNIKDTSS